VSRKKDLEKPVSVQQELNFPSQGEMERLPSPKRNSIETKARKHLPWASNYAAYSSEFALAAVDFLKCKSSQAIYDPFVGSGTTLEAAQSSGFNSVGIDLNPYSALLSRCRVAINADLSVSTALLKKAAKERQKSVQQSNSVQLVDSVSSLRMLLARRLACDPDSVVSILCADSHGIYDSEAVSLVAALHAIRKSAKVHHRSNPAWLISGDSPDGEETNSSDWISTALSSAESIYADLSSRKATLRPECIVHPCTFQDAPIYGRKISRFITSPPYLNRLDYVNPTIPELSSLGIGDDDVIEAIRTKMMGTTKMRPQVNSFSIGNSKTLVELLVAIAEHPTKASATYYLRFFQQYFLDLLVFLSWLSKHTTPTCKGLLVVQDSYYKDIKVPIVEIMTELASTVGLNVSILIQESRRRHMGQMSPHQRAHAPAKLLTEFTLMLAK
jgi:DNA methylase